MKFDERYIIGFITIFLVTSSIIYLSMEDVKIRIDDDKTTFYVFNDNSRWETAGREYNSIMDGTSKLNRKLSGIKINQTIDNNLITIIRETPYKDNILIRDTYSFNGSIDDITKFPISHKVEIYNASGMFYRYEVRDLTYSGDSYKLDGDVTSVSFGLNMIVEIQEDYRWAWVYQIGILKAQYDIDSDYEVFNVRLFDPPTALYLAGYERNITSELGSSINVTATGTGTMCLDIDHPDYGINVSCQDGGLQYDANISSFSSSDYNINNINSTANEYIITANGLDEVNKLFFDLNGTGNADVKVYFNNTLINDFSECSFNDKVCSYDSFNDSSTSISFYRPDEITKYIRINKNANISSFNITLNGTVKDYVVSDTILPAKRTIYGGQINTSLDKYYLFSGSVSDRFYIETYNLSTNSLLSIDYNVNSVCDHSTSFYEWKTGSAVVVDESDYCSGNNRPKGFFVYKNAFFDDFRVREFKDNNCGVLGLTYKIPSEGDELGDIAYGSDEDSLEIIITRGGNTKAVINATDCTFLGYTPAISYSLNQIYGYSTSAYSKGHMILSGSWTDTFYVFPTTGTSVGSLLFTLADFNDYPTSLYVENSTNTFYINDKTDNRVYVYTLENEDLSNLKVDIGSDGIYEYNGTGDFTTSTTISLDIDTINQYMDSLCNDSEEFCDIPISFISDSAGVLNIEDISVNQPTEELSISLSNINEVLTDTNEIVNLTILIINESSSITFSNLNYGYIGGNQTYNFKVHDTGYTNQINYSVTYYDSNWDWFLPRNIQYLEFAPRTSKSTGVSPKGQTSTTPILNISNLNYNSLDSDYYILNNDTDGCVDLYASTNASDKTQIKLNTSWQVINTGQEYDTNYGIWLYADYNCTGSSWRLFNPELYLRACCDGCDLCSEALI